jgi:NADH:ubiquinone oxidoreductase subunit F (NADH-binding)/(2Fe-2S) ferredoxin/NAD-dependent dihydropyrimidine dehydrogenase PreA subunit
MRIESTDGFEPYRRRVTEARAQRRKELLVCCGTGCLANGAARVVDAVVLQLNARGLTADLGVFVKKTGCHGCCQRGPLVVVEPAGVLYTRVQPKDAAEIVETSVERDDVVKRLLYANPADRRSPVAEQDDIPFYREQTRIALRHIGHVDPGDIDDAIVHGAYRGLVHALGHMQPEEVIAEIERSGLRGRGGAGFPTGRKWRACRRAPGDRRFVVCNGDEGDPGAFKDRSLMEGDPHAVIEGMIVGAFAVGSHEGYVYVRDEYPLAVSTLSTAIEQARDRGLLGRNVMGTGFDFDLAVSRGGGAFVCGESSALMRSIEGQTGEPRAKHVHATTRGLFGCPTVLNNVETWSVIPEILQRGADWFAGLGTPASKGTKAFSLVGKVANTGLVEVPMGTSLRRIVFAIGGGVIRGRPLKAVQTGGPSGGCLPETMLDLPVDYERLSEAGSMMGSGGLIVMDDRTCMVDVARYFLRFLAEESCGKCTPCREGLKQMLAIFDRLVAGRGQEGDIERIEALASAIQQASLCELGRSAVNPVLSTLRYFRHEYLAHVLERACPAGICRALTRYSIDEAACNGCHACVAACPAAAIRGGRKAAHTIDPAACISCGACFDACRRGAVRFSSNPERTVGDAEVAG